MKSEEAGKGSTDRRRS